jgi:hypothetical protein
MPASADSSQKLNHDAIAMARFFSGLLGQIALMILISLLMPAVATAGRMGVAPLYFALFTALSLFLLLQMTVSRYDVPTTDIAPTHDSVIISQRR